MKSNEFITEEKRFPTGVRNTSVLDPSSLSGKSIIDRFSGDPMGKDIGGVQERNFDSISAVLKRNRRKFKYLGWIAYTGTPDYLNRSDPKKTVTLTRFIMTAPDFVWEKYEGSTAGGGRNTVYVGGQKMKLTAFLKLPPKRQDALVNLKAGDVDKDILKGIPAAVKNSDPVKLFKSNKMSMNHTDYAFFSKLVKIPKKEWTPRQWQQYNDMVGYRFS